MEAKNGDFPFRGDVQVKAAVPNGMKAFGTKRSINSTICRFVKAEREERHRARQAVIHLRSQFFERLLTEIRGVHHLKKLRKL